MKINGESDRNLIVQGTKNHDNQQEEQDDLDLDSSLSSNLRVDPQFPVRARVDKNKLLSTTRCIRTITRSIKVSIALVTFKPVAALVSK